jgi:malonyl CoA-acyl carrier protein transacylase/phosphopantetheinyl transferase
VDTPEAVLLTPVAALAVVDVAVCAPATPNRDAFWTATLEYPVPVADAVAARDGLSSLVERWCTGRVGLAVCCAPSDMQTEAVLAAAQRRFCDSWVGGGGAPDAGAALRWVLAGFAEGRFERAVLGATSPTGTEGTAETWLVLTPADRARAAGLPALACWGERPEAGAILLVTAAGGGRREIEAGLTAAVSAEPPSLPVRTLWMPAADGATDAHRALTACAAAVLAVAHRALPASCGVADWYGPRERRFGHFPQPRPWLREPGREPRTALAVIPTGDAALTLSFSDADAAGPDPLALPRQAHLFVLSAQSRAALRAEIQALRERAAVAQADMAAIAAELWSRVRHPHRCAVVARGAADLDRHLAAASARLDGAKAASSPRERVLLGASEYAGTPIAFVIPGQGPQYAGMLREIVLASSAARRAFELVAAVFTEGGTSLMPRLFPARDVIGTELGHELEAFWRDITGGGLVGCAASQALTELLAGHGVPPAMFLGHSLGETTAMTLAEGLGPNPPRHVEALARAVGGLRAELLRVSQHVGEAGVAVSGVDRGRIERALEAHAGQAFLALDNCPHQVVLLGERSAIDAIAADLRTGGAACLDVSLGAPFHTPLFSGAAGMMSAFYDGLGVRAPRISVWSGAGNAPFPDDAREIKSLLVRQWAETVRFAASVRSLYDRGVRVFVEVGPGDTLSGFIVDTLGDRDHLAIACDSPWFGGVEHFLAALGRLFVAGIEVEPLARVETPRVQASTPRKPARPSGGEAAAIQAGHAALLRELEASRARLLGALPAGGNPALGRSSSGKSAFPALGARRDEDDGSVVFERRLTVESDLYLKDHLFRGKRSPYGRDASGLPVVPMVMTLEMLAEAGLAAASPQRRACVARIERLRLHRWLALDRGYLDVRLVARLQPGAEPDRWKADVELFELHEAAPAGRWSAAEATVVSAMAFPQAPRGRRLADQSDGAPRQRFLNELMFQGPSLLSFGRTLRLTKEGIEAELVVPARDRVFAGDPAPAFATAATLMDGAGQTVARWAVEDAPGWDGIYPFYADRYEQFGPLPKPGERLRCVAFAKDEGGVIGADVEVQRPDGAVLFRYGDFRQRRFPMTPEVASCLRTYDVECDFTQPFEAGTGFHARLLDGAHHDILRPERAIFLQAIAHTMLGARELEVWRAMPPGSPRRAHWLMGRIAAKAAVRSWAEERYGQSLGPTEIEVGSDERGRPTVSFAERGGSIGPPALSISHADTMAAAVVAEDLSVGVDLEEERDGSPRSVPEIAFAEGERAEAERAGVPPIALWCAKEAAAKALGVGLLGEPSRWRVGHLSPDGSAAVVQIEALRVPVTLQRRDRATIAVAQVPHHVAAEARETLRVGGAAPTSKA